MFTMYVIYLIVLQISTTCPIRDDVESKPENLTWTNSCILDLFGAI